MLLKMLLKSKKPSLGETHKTVEVEKLQEKIKELNEIINKKNKEIDKKEKELAKSEKLVQVLESFSKEDLFSLPNNILEKLNLDYPIYRCLEQYTVPTAICKLGGCEYKEFEFSTEKEALVFAANRIIKGIEMSTSPCNECRSEYIQNCI